MRDADRLRRLVFAIDASKLAVEARFDGIFLLRTNTRVTPSRFQALFLS